MTEIELRRAFEAEKPFLQAWGKAVQENLLTAIQERIGTRNLTEFLKIPCDPRVKDTESFLEKALRRGKSYERPLDQITDKVGVRIVVLLKSELKCVADAIEKSPLWEWQKDKDFESERVERPHHFDYQSDHYIVRARTAFNFDSVTVPYGTPCEVQVRTLLQHAYAELSHDRVYKPSGTIDLECIRQVAKSAALVETTDEIFVAVNDKLQKANASIQRVHEVLCAAYSAFVGEARNSDFRLSNVLLDAYREQLTNITKESVGKFLKENDFIAEKIQERAPLSTLFRHPIVIAVYFLVQTEPDLVPKRWPFDLKHLDFIYSDLGISTNGRL